LALELVLLQQSLPQHGLRAVFGCAVWHSSASSSACWSAALQGEPDELKGSVAGPKRIMLCRPWAQLGVCTTRPADAGTGGACERACRASDSPRLLWGELEADGPSPWRRGLDARASARDGSLGGLPGSPPPWQQEAEADGPLRWRQSRRRSQPGRAAGSPPPPPPLLPPLQAPSARPRWVALAKGAVSVSGQALSAGVTRLVTRPRCCYAAVL